MSSSPTMLDPRMRLQDVVSEREYAERAISVIQRIGTTRDRATVLQLLQQSAQTLGAEQAVFVTFIRDDDSIESFRFLLACDPLWCMHYQAQGWYVNDPWLLYAENSSEPICASRIPARTKSQRESQALAAAYGFASSYIVPAPASSGLSRLGVLCLGSSQAGYFESPAVGSLKVIARGLAMELLDWWVRQIRQEIIAKNRITPDDLQLLELERLGMGTKEIAERLGMTTGSVDSRFQRLNMKFNAPNRRTAARLAAEYGLV